MSCPPVAVTTNTPPPAAKPPSEQQELEALLLSIPPACSSIEPLETIACPEKQPEPAHACVVERYDTRAKRLTDRLVYSGTQLISEEQIVSAHTRVITTFTWDDKNRLTEKSTCFTAGVGEPEWFPTWRPPMAVYEQPYHQQNRTRVTYDGDTTRPRFAQIDSTAGEASSRMKLCYAYDENGKRARRIQTYRDQKPASLQVESRKYSWTDQQLASIDFRSVALKERSLAGKSQYSVAFKYDSNGRLSDQLVSMKKQPPSKVHFTWDKKGRFVAFGDIAIDWDERGRLSGLHPEDADLDGHFEWDESGRIKSATFKSGGGFSVSYGPQCAPGFSPPPVTPSVDGYLFYEGKDEL